jgi:elongation factor 1-beta
VKKKTVFICRLPGVKKSLDSYGAGAGGEKAADGGDDDDFDLFGSDDEEEPEKADKEREAKLKAYADKKAKSTK